MSINTITVERNYTKKGAPKCGLYIVLPETFTLQTMSLNLRKIFAAINASTYEKNMHVVEFDPNFTIEKEKTAQIFAGICKHNGIVFIIKNDIELAKTIKADGIIIGKDELNDIARYREMLGDDAIIGINCKNSKEIAIEATQQKVDYLYLEKCKPEFFNWSSTYTDIPTVAASNITPDNAAAFVTTGADFLDCSNYIWKHKESVAKAVIELNIAIEKAVFKGRVIN
jgi:thiamine-phosphate pyrophosphorylase